MASASVISAHSCHIFDPLHNAFEVQCKHWIEDRTSLSAMSYNAQSKIIAHPSAGCY